MHLVIHNKHSMIPIMISLILVLLISFSEAIKFDYTRLDSSEWNSITRDSFVRQSIQSILDARDVSVDPCQSFYQFSCGGWLNQTQIPPAATRYARSFSVIQERNELKLKAMLESGLPIVSPFYKSCMDVATIDSKGYQPLQPYLDRFATPSNKHSIHQLLQKSMSAYYNDLGHLRRTLDVSPMFSSSVTINQKDPSSQWLDLGQGGLSLPSRAQYFKQDLMNEYRDHISKMFRLVGQIEVDAAADADRIVSFERALANLTIPAAKHRDPFLRVHTSNVTHLQQIPPMIDWKAWMSGVGLGEGQFAINVADPSFFIGLSQLIDRLGSERLTTLTAVARWHLLNTLSMDLSTPLRDEHFMFFGRRLTGQRSLQPRWKYCSQRTSQLMETLMDPLYLNQTFSNHSRAAVTIMVAQLKFSMLTALTQAEWMDDVTRQKALQKLSLMVENVGGNTQLNLHAYDSLNLNADDYVNSVLMLKSHSTQSNLLRLFQATKRSVWSMKASEVNAYFSPSSNSINLPAGILSEPFFHESYPTAMQFGGIGMIIMHEISHSYDDAGRLYDGQGALIDWWTPKSSEQFNKRANCFRSQYSNYTIEALGVERVNGNLTAGENIADNVGVSLAYQAYERLSKPSDAERRLFFSSFAADWCRVTTPQAADTLLMSDVHSPSEVRVNGPLSNMKEFSALYNCPVGSPMNPVNKCKLY